MTEQEKIEQAAIAYANKLKTEGVTPSFAGVWDTAIAFALSELCPARMEKFSEWLRTFEALERQNGQWVIESQLSDKDIVKAFIEDIKLKQHELHNRLEE